MSHGLVPEPLLQTMQRTPLLHPRQGAAIRARGCTPSLALPPIQALRAVPGYVLPSP
jgi:hypothetical protein